MEGKDSTKLKPQELGEEHIGCLCALGWAGRSFGFTGHSSHGGLEGNGTVSSSNFIVGRLCAIDDEYLMFLTAWTRRHSMGLSFSSGPRTGMEYDVYSLRRENIYGQVYVNIEERSNSIRQHLQAKDKGYDFWLIWPKVKRHWDEL